MKIAMNQARLMNGNRTIHHLGDHFSCVYGPKNAELTHDRLQISTVHQFHHDECSVLPFACMNGPNDVRRVHLAETLYFAPKPLGKLRIFPKSVMNDFQSKILLQQLMSGAVDASHSPLPQPMQQFVLTEAGF